MLDKILSRDSYLYKEAINVPVAENINIYASMLEAQTAVPSFVWINAFNSEEGKQQLKKIENLYERSFEGQKGLSLMWVKIGNALSILLFDAKFVASLFVVKEHIFTLSYIIKTDTYQEMDTISFEDELFFSKVLTILEDVSDKDKLPKFIRTWYNLLG